MDPVVKTPADILTLEYNVIQNVCVMKKTVIISQDVNREVMLILVFLFVFLLELDVEFIILVFRKIAISLQFIS